MLGEEREIGGDSRKITGTLLIESPELVRQEYRYLYRFLGALRPRDKSNREGKSVFPLAQTPRSVGWKPRIPSGSSERGSFTFKQLLQASFSLWSMPPRSHDNFCPGIRGLRGIGHAMVKQKPPTEPRQPTWSYRRYLCPMESHRCCFGFFVAANCGRSHHQFWLQSGMILPIKSISNVTPFTVTWQRASHPETTESFHNT